ncbi:MAG: DUF3373 family protein [Desulfuromonadaceae bacterium]|nr:DUF3373 family protein [Desulfuromonas sp.]MDY0185530.1 DUF3373 family protein [Desulfuromonadaceae bacterium]
MVRKMVGVLLATLMLLPTSVLAAPTATQLEKQVQMLAEQLEEMRAQLQEVQDAASNNSDSVEILETSAEKWDAASRIQFSGDYRFRMDYSDTATKGYWGAMDIANAVADMNKVTGMDTQSILGMMNTYTPAQRKGMMEDLPNSLAGMGLMQQGIIPGTAAFAAAFPAALAQVNAAGVTDGYTMTRKNNWKNDILYTNRFRLGMKADISDNLEFKGRLAMYKAWGMQENPTAVGPYYMNSFSQMDGATSRQPNDSILRVDRAYINWNNVADLPIWISIGRRPTTDGPPAQLRMGLDSSTRMATPVNFMDYAFDGATIGAVFQNPFEFMGYSKIRFCYGRGFEAGPTDRSNELNDMDFGGISWDIINKGDRFMNIQVFLAANIINVPSGVDFANPLEIAMGTGDGWLDRENLGDIYHTSFVYLDKAADLNYFIAGGWSHTDPSGTDEMGSTLLGSWWNDPGDKDGYTIYGGVRYDMTQQGLKFGLEYNYGTKYWISMTPGHDDMTQAKLATRGHVGEAYVIWDLPVGQLLSDKAKAFMRLGYQHYEYNYTGSGNWLGAPVDIDKLDDPLSAQFFAPIERMDQVYLTLEAWF